MTVEIRSAPSGADNHLLMLDALRGVAALSVVISHRRAWFGDDMMPHAFLAVDFFFVLSGFVIDRAYAERLRQGMSGSDFIVRRVIRLYPLVFISLLLAVLVEIARAKVEGGSFGGVVGPAAAHLAMLPSFGGREPYPLNPPLWSLFFEMFANIIFLFAAPYLTRRALGYVVLATGTALITLCLWTGSLGHGLLTDHFSGGYLRVSFPFFMGCYVHRLYKDGVVPRLRIGNSSVILLLLLFSVPVGAWSVPYSLICISVIFPCLVLSAARFHTQTALARISGELSYPLYVLHIPLLFLLAGALRLSGISDNTPSAWEGSARIVAVCILSWLVFVWFDRPVRAWLTAAYGKRLRRVDQGTSLGRT